MTQVDADMDPITRAPYVAGDCGRAWHIDAFPADTACIAMWLIEAPHANRFWHSYAITLIHLRPMPDRQPIMFYLPKATHEMWLAAVDPSKPRQIMLDAGVVRELTPLNFAAQLIHPSDADAVVAVERAVRAICDGTLNPDTDYITQWIELFGENMVYY